MLQPGRRGTQRSQVRAGRRSRNQSGRIQNTRIQQIDSRTASGRDVRLCPEARCLLFEKSFFVESSPRWRKDIGLREIKRCGGRVGAARNGRKVRNVSEFRRIEVCRGGLCGRCVRHLDSRASFCAEGTLRVAHMVRKVSGANGPPLPVGGTPIRKATVR